jgi:hypothetical protein
MDNIYKLLEYFINIILRETQQLNWQINVQTVGTAKRNKCTRRRELIFTAVLEVCKCSTATHIVRWGE